MYAKKISTEDVTFRLTQPLSLENRRNIQYMNWKTTIFPTLEAKKEQRSSSKQQGTSDELLFDRFLGGDDRALVELFDRHNHRLYLYCLQFVHDPQRAEDVTQEMWEKVIRLRADGRATSQNPMGLLVTIVRNLCLDDIRKQRYHSPLEDLPETNHPTATIRELSHMEELVLLALPHLPEAQREVLVLSAYSGYRFDEIADMLGEPVGAIRTRAWRARVHLGRMISALVGIDEDKEKDGDRHKQEMN